MDEPGVDLPCFDVPDVDSTLWMMDIPVVDDPFVTVFPISNRHLRLRKLRRKDKGDEGRKDQEIKSGRK